MLTLAVILVVLQAFGVSSQAKEPLIQHCLSNQKTSGACKYHEIYNTAFKFGRYSQNVRSIEMQTDQFLHLRCRATYPIHWLAQNPLVVVHYTLKPEFSHSTSDLTFVQELVIPLRSNVGGVFRCESFSGDGMIAELFANTIGNLSLNASLLFPQSTLTYFEVNTNGAQTSRKLIFPCVANYFKKNPTAKLTKLSRQSKGLQVSVNCALCICTASSECSSNEFPCTSSHVCGLRSSKWQVRGVNSSTEHDGSNSCTNRLGCSMCAVEALEGYLDRIHDSVTDCNADGVISCEDYALTYLVGHKDCNRTLSNKNQVFYKRFESCLGQKKQTFEILKTAPEEFDPRIGFRSALDANFESLYACSSLKSVQYMIPLSPYHKVNAILNYGNKTGDAQGFTCDPDGAVQNLQIQIGVCESITDCDLKFRHIAPVVAVVQNSQESRVELESYGEIPGLMLNKTHGYVKCTARFFGTTSPNVVRYVNEADYFFTGLDDHIYLFSKEFPNASIISLQNSNTQMKLNVLHYLECKISTFVLLPLVYFEVQYSDNQLPSSYITLDQNGIQAIPTDGGTETVKAWRLYLNVTENMTRILCWAPWISLKRWASAALPVNMALDKVEGSGAQKNDPDPALNKYIIIGISTAGALVLASALIIVIVCRKYLKSKAIIRKLTDEEVEEFLKGDKSRSTDESSLVIESLGFSSDMVIPANSLQICDEVLGSGEFGIVHKGTYEEKTVAVKSCKPNADADYFKAFLKELKVMAFIGRHENVVVFQGAVIEEIQKGICYAVIEYCPFDNLHNYLREHSASYGIGLSSPDIINETGSKNEGVAVLNQSILVSFCKQIANGMDFVSAKKVIHADLATRNVLVFPNNVIKITDFGLSRKLYNCANYTKSKRGPLPWRWMALESLRFFRFSTKSDVWSFGVTIWEIFSFAQVPFSGLSWTADFTEELESGLRLPKPQIASQEIYDMIQRCCENDPDNRPTFTECKAFFINLESSVHNDDDIYGTVRA